MNLLSLFDREGLLVECMKLRSKLLHSVRDTKIADGTEGD